MQFCSICGLFARVSTNMNKNPIYVCKCKFGLRSNQICETCGLFKNNQGIYGCNCTRTSFSEAKAHLPDERPKLEESKKKRKSNSRKKTKKTKKTKKSKITSKLG